jgi:hypothetical protein
MTLATGSRLGPYEIVSSLGTGAPKELFHHPESQQCRPARCFDLSPDGQRFLMRFSAVRWSEKDREGQPQAAVSRPELPQE